MREFKFRAWDLHEMHYNITPTGSRECLDLSARPLYRKVECIMQFTGLKDKNGKDIYEGDIVKFNDSLNLGGGQIHKKCVYKSPVVYEYDSFCISSTQENNMGLYCRNDECEIIGNIYEKPELL